MVAFIEGCNQANAGSLPTGFREWLVTKAGCGNELVWWALTGHRTEPVGRKSVHDMTPEQDRQPSIPCSTCWMTSSLSAASTPALFGSMKRT